MVLVHDVVEVFDLPHSDRRFTSDIDLVHRDRLGKAACLHGFFKEVQGCRPVAPGRQAKDPPICLLDLQQGKYIPRHQLPSTGRLRVRNTFSNSDRNRIAQRLIEE